MAACCTGSPCARILIDGANIDGVLGSILGHRPLPHQRPRWDRVRRVLCNRAQSAVRPEFVVTQQRVAPNTFPFFRTLRQLGLDTVPVESATKYPGNNDPVDEYILDSLHDLLDSAKTGAEPCVIVASHDHIFAPVLEQIVEFGGDVVIVGFEEEFSPQMLDLSDREGCELLDLEFDVAAFDMRLPRFYRRRCG